MNSKYFASFNVTDAFVYSANMKSVLLRLDFTVGWNAQENEHSFFRVMLLFNVGTADLCG